MFLPPSVCVYMCMYATLSPACKVDTHIYLLQYPTYTLHKQSISTSWTCYKDKLSSIEEEVVRPCKCKHCEGGCMTWQHRAFGFTSQLCSSFTTKPCLSLSTCKSVYNLTAPLSGLL